MDEETKKDIQEAVDNITDYLLEHTSEYDGFEVIPELDTARSLLMDILETQQVGQTE